MKKLKQFLMPMYLFLLLYFSFLPAQTQELPQIVKKIIPSTVIIFTYDEKEKKIGQGSGFFVGSNGDIITNRHVLSGAYSAKVKTSDGKVYSITRIVAENNEADIVRASVNIPEPVHHLSLSNSIPEVGEKIAVISNPLGLEQTVSDGIVSAVREMPRFGRIYQITAPISPGSSGGPTINMKGEVIGVASFQFTEGQNLNFVIPSEHIAKLKVGVGKPFKTWAMENVNKRIVSAGRLYSAGRVFCWVKDYKKALTYFEKAVKQNPNYADAYFFIGYCNGELGRYTEAIEAFKQAIRLRPDFADAHCNLGITYDKLGRYTEAIEAYKQAIRLNPDFATAHYYLGITYGELGRYTEAIEAYKQAIRLRPDFADAHCNLGVSYHKLGRYTEAIEAFKQAIRLNPDFATAHYYLGIVYLIVGDKGSALDEYKILKELDKDLANKLFSLIYK